MASIKNFRVDSKAVESGAWVSPGDEFDDLEIMTRGVTDIYNDARNAKLRRAAVRYGGDVSKIPSAISRGITVDCLIEHVLIDVRHLVDETGNQISFAQFCEMLHNADYLDLVVACLKAAAIVGLSKQNEIEDAKKN